MTAATWGEVVDERETWSVQRAAEATDPNVPDPSLPLSDVQVYQSVAITEVTLAADPTLDLSEPVDLLSGAERAHPQSPAIGVLLHLEQGWRMRGLTKGRLAHSLCLAPGEVTQVAMVGWERGTSARTSESMSEQEAASRDADRTRLSSDVTTAVASEMQSGGSSVSAFSAQADVGVGGVLGFLGFSGGSSSNASLATSASWSLGARDAASDARNSVREATSQHASNTRARVATLVQEVSQSETERFTSRVVANYNHMHALNVQYYEVLQAYELSARPVRAERLIFLPMQLMEFDRANAATFALPLARAATAMGRPVLARAIEHNAQTQERSARQAEQLEQTHATLSAQVAVVAAEVAQLQQRRAEAEANLSETAAALPQLEAQVADAMRRRDQAESDWGRFTMLAAMPEDFRRSMGFDGALQLMNVSAIQAARAAAPAEIDELNSRRAPLMARIAESAAAMASVVGEAEPVQMRLGFLSADLALAAGELATVRAVADAEAGALVKELNEDHLALNQALWLQMDPATVQTLIADREHQGQPIADTIDPVPVAIVGTYVGYRWAFAQTAQGQADADAFHTRYVEQHRSAALDSYVLPTGGLFAESVLGRAVAAEELDLTRFWRWDDDTIPILPTAIETLTSRHRAQRAESRPGLLGTSAAQLGAMPAELAGPSHALSSVISTSLMRDMSGSEVVGGILTAAQQVTGTGAQHAQQVAHENISAFLDHAEKLLPELSKAISAGSQKLKAAAAKAGSGETGEKGEAKGGVDPSLLGALSNAIGGGEAGFDTDALLGIASKIGLLL